jgi:hypothetical protein
MPSPHSTFAGDIDMTKLKTFGNTGKELTVLEAGREAELLSHKGRGCLTHMWFGGGFEGCSRLRIRIYVDGETTASIDMELFLGHGIGFADETAVPWGTPRIGKLGTGTSVYDTYRIPFGSSIRVTAQLPPDIHANPLFWWIVRGTENLPVQIGGVTLPDNARLHLYKVVDKVAQPLEEFPLCDVKGDGALYEVTMAAQGLRTTTVEKDRWQDLAFMEGCMRAYKDGDPEPLMLSSGLEDYFLGTYYFNKGLYHTPVAGCTHLDVAHNSFSAYRFHDDDPVFFHDGLKLTARCGEKIAPQPHRGVLASASTIPHHIPNTTTQCQPPPAPLTF